MKFTSAFVLNTYGHQNNEIDREKKNLPVKSMKLTKAAEVPASHSVRVFFFIIIKKKPEAGEAELALSRKTSRAYYSY